MKKLNCVMVLMFLIVAACLRAGEIVPILDDSTALADYTDAYGPGTESDITDITSGQITLAARFNPDASQMTGGAVYRNRSRGYNPRHRFVSW